VAKFKKMEIASEIRRLKKEQNCVIFAHNYQPREIFEIADEIGDSFELARAATNISAEKVIFAGVKFMAEMVKILDPAKRVFLPDLNSTCPMAAMFNRTKFEKLKSENPRAAVVGYVNTTAETKTFCDACATSANAVRVCEKLSADEIIFLPDENLAKFVQSKIPRKKIIPFPGFCPIHCKFDFQNFSAKIAENPNAPVLIHPEMPPEFWKFATEILSTGGILKFVKNSSAPIFLIGTEDRMCERLKLEFPTKKFIPLLNSVCDGMAANSPEKILSVLQTGKNEIVLPEEILIAAKAPLKKMLELSR
jgi:quinolinate synthase